MIPSRQAWQAETTSFCYSSFFGPLHFFINLIFLPLAPHTHRHTFCFLHRHWCIPSQCELLCISVPIALVKHHLFSVLYWGSLIHMPLTLITHQRLHKTQHIIKVKSRLGLRTFLPKEMFPSNNCRCWQILKNKRVQTPVINIWINMSWLCTQREGNIKNVHCP